MALSKIDGRFDASTEYVLQIKGEQSSPQHFDAEKIVPVYDVSQRGFARLHERINAVVKEISVGNSTTANMVLLGQEGRTYGGLTPWYTYPRDRNVYVYHVNSYFFANTVAASNAINGYQVHCSNAIFVERALVAGGGFERLYADEPANVAWPGTGAGATAMQVLRARAVRNFWLPSGGAIGMTANLPWAIAWPGVASDYGFNCRCAYVDLPVGVSMPV